MKRLQPVVWSKGTFLSPQHLQTQDRFIESALQFRLGASNFRPWGFSELRINQQELAAGNFVISSAQGILPDGLPLDMRDSDPPPPLRPLGPYFQAEKDRLDVFLALPHYPERRGLGGYSQEFTSIFGPGGLDCDLKIGASARRRKPKWIATTTG